jgi:ribonucleoside-diphosphate reductase alpha chain
MPSIAGPLGIAGQSMCHPGLREMRFDMAATDRITPIDESEVAVNESAGPECSEPTRAVRRHLPDERRALTHHFSIAGQEGYLTVGVYEDGLPGEIFITMAKQGSTISGLMDAFATVVSLALQHGVPLSVLCDKLSHMRFEPSGWSGNPKIGYAKSLMDYIARWLELRFLAGDQGELFKALPMRIQPALDANSTDPVGALGELIQMGDAPACNICGSLMVRSGTCYRCGTCGSTSGCS